MQHVGGCTGKSKAPGEAAIGIKSTQQIKEAIILERYIIPSRFTIFMWVLNQSISLSHVSGLNKLRQ
jgi:hypothetical protein